jgi:hypothetical protein
MKKAIRWTFMTIVGIFAFIGFLAVYNDLIALLR